MDGYSTDPEPVVLGLALMRLALMEEDR